MAFPASWSHLLALVEGPDQGIIIGGRKDAVVLFLIASLVPLLRLLDA